MIRNFMINLKERPEILFPLFGDLKRFSKIGPKVEKNFKNAGFNHPIDLLFLLPSTYIHRIKAKSILNFKDNYISIKVKVLSHDYNHYKKIKKILVTDGQTTFDLVFFNLKESYLKKVLPIEKEVLISGKVDYFKGKYQIIHPDYILDINQNEVIDEFDPVYPLFKGISQKLIKNVIREIINITPEFEEWIDNDLLKKKNWSSFNSCLKQIHNPNLIDIYSNLKKCRERLAFDEILSRQMMLFFSRSILKQNKNYKRELSLEKICLAKKNLPFQLTISQNNVIEDITNDLKSSKKMNRLLQGDVGSGKTIVAFIIICAFLEKKLQIVFLAPTEVLAKQHYKNFLDFSKGLNVNVGILTGSDKGKTRTSKLEKIRTGEFEVIFGTHALFQKDLFFNNLKLVVIDEQHKFGVKQRIAMAKKGENVDILVMSATPIPRSLSFSKYGDLDFSEIKEKPKERKKIITSIISEKKVKELVNRLSVVISKGEKIYWVCPSIEESEVFKLSSVKTRFEYLLKNIKKFPNKSSIGLIHGQMNSDEKNKVMNLFSEGKISVLVSTTVIEVGIDVKDASIMIIEGAERFGLAQLHQLRGRIGRGEKESKCVLIYSSNASLNSINRLKILKNNDNGFEIAEKDLEIRGEGMFLGTQQSGFENYKVVDLYEHKLLFELANKETKKIYNDSNLFDKNINAYKNLIHLMQKEFSKDFVEIG